MSCRPAAFVCYYMLLGALTVLTAPAADWPTYQHDLEHTGRSTAVINASQLTLSWEAPDGYAMPQIVGKTIYSTKSQGGYAGSQGDGKQWATYISAFDLATGAIKWTHSGNYVFASPAAVGGGLVVFHGGSPAGSLGPPTPGAEQLIVLDAATGALRYKVPGIFERNDGTGPPGSMPLLIPNPADGTVMAYYVEGATMWAVRLGPTSGAIVWKQSGIFGNAIPTRVGNSIVVANACRFYAFDQATGAANLFHQGTCTGGSGTTAAYDSARQQIYILQMATPPGTLSSEQALTAYKYVSNSQIDFLWQRVGPGIGRGSVALGPTGNVYAAGAGLLLELNPATGATIRSVSGRFGMTPAVTAGVLWVNLDGESTMAFDLETLRPLRTLNGGNGSGSSTYSSVGAFADGYLVMIRGDAVIAKGFAVWVPSPTPLPPTGAQAKAKFNSDGYADINWQNSRTGERVMWFMRNGIFQSGIYLETIAPEWKIAGTADLNADGYSDYVWQNLQTGERVAWFLRDGRYQSGIYLPTFAPEWEIAASADFNADGYGDFVWQNVRTGERVIWFLRNGEYRSDINLQAIAGLETIAPEWRIAAAADFNADGYSDFVWQNIRTGERVMWFLRDGRYHSGIYLQTIAPEWRIAGGADYNNDQHADFIWQNINTGERVMWFLRNGLYQSGIYMQTIDRDWDMAVH